jgi:hypothetical protein
MYATVRLILILALGAWLCSACQPSTTASPADPTPLSESTAAPQLDPDIEEHAVYAALLESEFASENIKQVLIVDHTRVEKPERLEGDLVNFQENTPLAPELVASFKERNQQPYPLEPSMDLGLEYQLLTQEQIDELRPQDEASDWKLFYEKYPNAMGFTYLSRAGFNADLSQALVYVSVYRYEQPILGGYYLMSRQDGRWSVEAGLEWLT